MNRYIEKLKSFLAEQSPCFGYDDANSILEMLYYYYTVANPIDNALIRCQFKELTTLSAICLYPNSKLFLPSPATCAFPTSPKHFWMEFM